jgi:hypothetical protein
VGGENRWERGRMPSQEQIPVDARGGTSNGSDETTPNGGGDGCGRGGGGRKHSSATLASSSASKDGGVGVDRQEKKRARSDQPPPPTTNDVDDDIAAEYDQNRDKVAVTNQQVIESITRREALRHVEMAWRAQQRLMRRCLGLRFLGDPRSVAIFDSLESGALAGDGGDDAERVDN